MLSLTKSTHAPALVLVLATVLLAWPLAASAVEEPAYTVQRSLPQDVEIRQYEPYVVAEVRVQAAADEAGNVAFPILAGYIFGKNKGERRMAMTAPVTQTPEPPSEPVKMAMTAPVTQTAADGGFVVQFVLPSDVTLATAPEPLDARVMLREEPARRLAAIRYSGFWSDANYQKHLSRLQQVLQDAGIAWTGDPVYSRYNDPFTPWFLRHNEIWLVLP